MWWDQVHTRTTPIQLHRRMNEEGDRDQAIGCHATHSVDINHRRYKTDHHHIDHHQHEQRLIHHLYTTNHSHSITNSYDPPTPSPTIRTRRRQSMWWILVTILCTIISHLSSSSIQLVAGAANSFTFSPSLGATTSMFIGDTKTITVSLTAAPQFGTLNLTIAKLSGTGSVTSSTGGTTQPIILSWPKLSTISNTFHFVAPASIGTGTFTFTISGLDTFNYNTVSNQVMTWAALNTFTVGAVTPSPIIYVNQSSNSITITPSATVVATTTITFSVSGSTTMVFSPTSLTFSAGATSALSFKFTERFVNGTIIISYLISGAGAAQWSPINSTSVNITAQESFQLDPIPAFLYISNPFIFSFTPTATPNPSVSLNYGTTAGTLSPTSPLAFSSTTTNSFTLTTTSTPQWITIYFSVSGTDLAHYSIPKNITIEVRAKQTITTIFSPPTSAFTKFYANQPMTFNISNNIGANITSWLGVTMTAKINSVVQWTWFYNFTSTNLLGIYDGGYIAPAVWPSSSSTMTVSYALSGTIKVYFVTPSSQSFTLANQTALQFSYVTSFATDATSNLAVKLLVTPPNAVGLIVNYDVSNAVSFSPASQTFLTTNFGTYQNVAILTTSTPLTYITVTVTLSGVCTVAYYTPAPFQIRLVSSFMIDPTSIAAVSTMYTWPNEPPAALLITPHPYMTATDGGLVLNMTTSTSRALGSGSLTFAPSDSSTQTMIYRQPTTTGSETLLFADFGTDASIFLPPSNVPVSIIAYPANSYGPTGTACTCSTTGAICSTGWWGDGSCACKTGFTGATCSSCLPGYWGSTCKACTCVYGTCSDGSSGTGACTCQNSNWYGTTCSTASFGRLLPKIVSASCVQDTTSLVIFAATQTSGWWTIITTLPALGSIYSTPDGTTLGTIISTVPYTIPSASPQKVIYVPPPGDGLPPNSGVYASFIYRVQSSTQNNNGNTATVSLIVNTLNGAPVINLDSSITPNAVAGTHATSGSMLGAENLSSSLNVFNVTDPDAISTTATIALTISVPTGTLGFAFNRTMNPAYLAYITPAPSSVLDYTYSTSSLVIDAPQAILNILISFLVYQPAAWFVGTEIISLSLNDHGNSGVTASNVVDTTGLTVTASISIYVQRVDQPISIITQSNLSTIIATEQENSDIPLNLVLTDIDAGSSTNIQFNCSADHGTFTSLVNGVPTSVAPVTYGTLDALNTLLSTLVYHPDLYYSGPETMILWATDNDWDGLNGPTVSLKSYDFNIAYVNFPPIGYNQTIQIDEDLSTIITLAGDSLDDATTSTLMYRISQLPDPACMKLYQYDPVTQKRGQSLTDVLPASMNLTSSASFNTSQPGQVLTSFVTSSTHQLMARMTYGSRTTVASTHGCPFQFETIKLTGPVSTPATITFNVTNLRNHPPTAYAQTTYPAIDVDTLIILNAWDPDGDIVTFWLGTLPTQGQLYQVIDNGNFNYTRSTLFAQAGGNIPSGLLYYHSSGSPSNLTDSFQFNTIDRPARSFGPNSMATVTLLLQTPVIVECPNITITVNDGAPYGLIDFQSDVLTATTTTGLQSITLLTSFPAMYGSLHLLATDSYDGSPALGSTVTAFSTLTLSPFLPAISQQLALYYEPPTAYYGTPLTNFTYSCVSLQNVPSDNIGYVTINVDRVDQPPIVPAELTFFGVSFASGLVGVSFNSNITDPDISAGTATWPTGGTSTLSVEMVVLPQFGSLKQFSNAPINSVPTTLTDSPGNRFSYIPTSSLTPPFYDTFVWRASDGLLQSGLSIVHVMVGATSMPPVIKATRFNVSVYEGGLPMKTLLPFNITEPKHLGTQLEVYVGELPAFGYLTTSSGSKIQFADSVIQQSTSLFLSIYYVPPVVRPTGVTADNFTLYVIDSLGERSIAPDLFISIGLLHLNQPPNAYYSQTTGLQDGPIKFIFNATTNGLLSDMFITLSSPFPDPLTQGSFYACSPNVGSWLVNATSELLVNDSTIDLIPGCDGVAGDIGLIFVPVQYFFTLNAFTLSRYAPSIPVNFKVHDGLVQTSKSVTAELDVEHVIYPPTAFDQPDATTIRDQAVILTLTGTDFEPQHNLTASITSFPLFGSLYQVNSTGGLGDMIVDFGSPAPLTSLDQTVMYVPNQYYYGVDSFNFTMSQANLIGGKTSLPANVSLNITYIPVAPFFDVMTLGVDPLTSTPMVEFNISENTRKIVNFTSFVLITDPDGGAIQFTVLTIPPQGSLYQIDPAFLNDSTSTPADFMLYISDLITIPNVPVLHPAGLLIYDPGLNQLGDNSTGYEYTRFTYSATNGILSTVNSIICDIFVFPVYQLPVVYQPFINVTTFENMAVVLQVSGSVDSNFVSSKYDVIISVLPTNGIICNMLAPGAKSASVAYGPCGSAYGQQILLTGTKVSDSLHRFVYLPNLDLYGPQLDVFEYQILDSSQQTSLPGVISVNVTFVNQPPYIPTTAISTYTLRAVDGTDPEYLSPILLDLGQTVKDPDNTLDELRFSLLNYPGMGLAYEVPDTTTMTPVAIDSKAITLPYFLPSPYLYFHSHGSGGGPNPYVTINYKVFDPSNLTASSTISINLDCGSQMFPNIWTVGTSKGPLCLACPTGASCSSLGIQKPVSQYGYWRSNILDANGGPIYVPCKVPSSCLSAPYDNGALSSDPSLTNSSTTASSINSCATGFQGRMCADCSEGYYYSINTCAACPSRDSSAYNQKLLAVYLIVAVICVACGLVLLWFLKKRLKIDLSFVGILLTFFQTLNSFKSFRLNWPQANGSFFDNFSFVSFNFDLLSLECSAPTLLFQTKWIVFMLLPIIAALLLIIGSICAAAACVWWQYYQIKRKKRKDTKDGSGEYTEKSSKSNGASAGDSIASPSPETVGDEENAFSPTPMIDEDGKKKHKTRPRTFCGLWHKWFVKFTDTGLGLFILFCDFIYLPLCIMCMNMLACTRVEDGTLSLDYQPGLRCDEPWWDAWSRVGIFFLFLYGIGIPLLYMYIFFHLRPQVRTYPLPFLPQWARPFFMCPRALNKSAWKADVLADVHARIKPNCEQELENYIQLQTWRKVFRTLVEPFSGSKYYWSTLVIIRSLLISMCAVFLQNAPQYQCACILVILAFALLLQLEFRPYKFHIKYNLNALETNSIIAQAFILTCGLIFFLSAQRDQSLGGVDYSLHYPAFRALLTVLIIIWMVIVGVFGFWIFARQMQWRIQYLPAWRHSQARLRVQNTRFEIDQFLVGLGLKKPNQYLVAQHSRPGSISLPISKGINHENDRLLVSPSPAPATTIRIANSSQAGGPGPTIESTATDMPIHHGPHRSILTQREFSHGSGLAPPDEVDLHGSVDGGNDSAHHHGGHHPLSRLPSSVSLFNGATTEATTPKHLRPNGVPAIELMPAQGVLNKRDITGEEKKTEREVLDMTPTPKPGDNTVRFQERDDEQPDTPTTAGTVDDDDPHAAAKRHIRAKSSVWRPPRLSVASPLRGLDARSLYTHARYVSLNDFTLRQICEINENATLMETEQQGYEGNPADATIWSDLPNVTAQSPSPFPGKQPPPPQTHTPTPSGQVVELLPHQTSNARDTPSHLTFASASPMPSAITNIIHPKHIAGVEIGRPTFGRLFKPPPPAGLFLKRTALAFRDMLALRKMFGHENPNETADDSHHGLKQGPNESLEAFQIRLKHHLHTRRLSVLKGEKRFKDLVSRLIYKRAYAKRVKLPDYLINPETGCAREFPSSGPDEPPLVSDVKDNSPLGGHARKRSLPALPRLFGKAAPAATTKPTPAKGNKVVPAEKTKTIMKPTPTAPKTTTPLTKKPTTLNLNAAANPEAKLPPKVPTIQPPPTATANNASAFTATKPTPKTYVPTNDSTSHTESSAASAKPPKPRPPPLKVTLNGAAANQPGASLTPNPTTTLQQPNSANGARPLPRKSIAGPAGTKLIDSPTLQPASGRGSPRLSPLAGPANAKPRPSLNVAASAVIGVNKLAAKPKSRKGSVVEQESKQPGSGRNSPAMKPMSAKAKESPSPLVSPLTSPTNEARPLLLDVNSITSSSNPSPMGSPASTTDVLPMMHSPAAQPPRLKLHVSPSISSIAPSSSPPPIGATTPVVIQPKGPPPGSKPKPPPGPRPPPPSGPRPPVSVRITSPTGNEPPTPNSATNLLKESRNSR